MIKTCIAELKQYEFQFDADCLTDQESIENLLIDIKNGEILVAEENNKIVGFVSFNIVNKNEELIMNDIPAIYISDIVVLAQYRHMGIGTKLIQEVESFAKEKGIKYLKLIAFSKNKDAIKVYEQSGFEDYEITMLKKI